MNEGRWSQQRRGDQRELAAFLLSRLRVYGPNVAVTDFAAFIVTVQVGAVPLQAPDQPVNVPDDEFSVDSVSTTVEPLRN